MKKITLLKMMLLSIILIGSTNVFGQASLPVNETFSNVTTSGAGTMPTGFTQSGLGGYVGSLKFDTQGDWLQLQFTGTAATLSFDLGVNASFPGTIPSTVTFTVQESSDGNAWNNLATYSNTAGGTKNISVISSSTKYIRWFYTTKPSGTNIALKNISLTASPAVDVHSVNDVEALKVFCSNNRIVFLEESGKNIEIFNSTGQRIYTGISINGSNEISLSNRGLLILKIGNKTAKVVL